MNSHKISCMSPNFYFIQCLLKLKSLILNILSSILSIYFLILLNTNFSNTLLGYIISRIWFGVFYFLALFMFQKLIFSLSKLFENCFSHININFEIKILGKLPYPIYIFNCSTLRRTFIVEVKTRN